MYLVCDSRERCPLPEGARVETLTLGDYHLRTDDKIFFIFERKTWKDLAASIKDGRYREQKKRLCEVARGGEIRVFYIIEGPMTYDDDKEISRVPFATLDTARRSMIFSGVFPIQTKSPEHTFDFLKKFMADFIRKNPELFGGGETNLAPVKHTREDYLAKIWGRIKGIGPKLLPVFLKLGLRDFFLECADAKVAQEIICGFKYDSGRAISDILAAKIVAQIRELTRENQIKILAEFPGFTEKSAKHVLCEISFLELLNLSAGQIAELEKTPGRKIGLILANKFVDLI